MAGVLVLVVIRTRVDIVFDDPDEAHLRHWGFMPVGDKVYWRDVMTSGEYLRYEALQIARRRALRHQILPDGVSW